MSRNAEVPIKAGPWTWRTYLYAVLGGAAGSGSGLLIASVLERWLR